MKMQNMEMFARPQQSNQAKHQCTGAVTQSHMKSYDIIWPMQGLPNSLIQSMLHAGRGGMKPCRRGSVKAGQSKRGPVRRWHVHTSCQAMWQRRLASHWWLKQKAELTASIFEYLFCFPEVPCWARFSLVSGRYASGQTAAIKCMPCWPGVVRVSLSRCRFEPLWAPFSRWQMFFNWTVSMLQCWSRMTSNQTPCDVGVTACGLWPQIMTMPKRPATDDELLLVHTKGHLSGLKRAQRVAADTATVWLPPKGKVATRRNPKISESFGFSWILLEYLKMFECYFHFYPKPTVKLLPRRG